MKTFNVQINVSDGRSTFVKGVKAVDEWQARTLVWFHIGSFKANGHEVTYKISEAN